MQPLDVSSPPDLEGKFMGLGVDRNGEFRVHNFDGGCYMKSYLSQSNFSYNKS